MKLNKLIAILSMLLLCQLFVSEINPLAKSWTIMVFAQEDQVSLLQRIKNSLIEQEPIVEKELVQVKDEDLLFYYQKASEDSIWQEVYQSIATNYPELKLLTSATEYTKYKQIIKSVSEISGRSLLELGNVDPCILIEAYDTNKAAGRDEIATVQTLLEQLNWDAGKLNVEQSSTTQNQNEKITMSANSTLRQALLEYTEITREQLVSISEEELLNTVNLLGLTIETINSEAVFSIYRQLVANYPERFSTEQIKSVANHLRLVAVSSLPFTEAIAEQIPDEDFLQWDRESLQTENKRNTYVYWAAINNYPELFVDAVTSAKERLAKNTQLTEFQLAQMDDAIVLLAEYQVRQNQITYKDIENQLIERYPNLVEDSSKNTSNNVVTEVTQVMTIPQSNSNSSDTLSSQIFANVTTDITTNKQLQSTQNLPQTGETNMILNAIASVGFLVGSVILMKRRTAGGEL